MKAGENTWTGISFNAQGEIITSSQDLGNAPLAEFRFADGATGQAWVAGRDDNSGLALLRPVGASRTYPFLPFSSSQPSVNAAMGLVQYSGIPAAAPTVFNTRITGFRPGFSGYNYLQIQAATNTTTNGAVVVNAIGQIQGIRLPKEYLVSKGIATANEVYAVASADVGGIAVPILQSGQYVVTPVVSTGTGSGPPSTPPAWPVLFHGGVSIDGQGAPIGTRLYARLVKQGKPDAWDDVLTTVVGRYDFPVAATGGGYDGARVEFWINGKRSATTTVYGTPGSITKLDLVF